MHTISPPNGLPKEPNTDYLVSNGVLYENNRFDNVWTAKDCSYLTWQKLWQNATVPIVCFNVKDGTVLTSESTA